MKWGKRMLKRKGEERNRKTVLKFQTLTGLTPLFEIAALSRVGALYWVKWTISNFFEFCFSPQTCQH